MSRRGGLFFSHYGTCRVCGQSGESTDMVKYSTRHYAHPDCALTKWGAAFFDRLTPWQCANRFPYMVASRYGVADALEARAALMDGKTFAGAA